jgi:TRAP-type C4-dicarboxylate transport system permease small subunit
MGSALEPGTLGGIYAFAVGALSLVAVGVGRGTSASPLTTVAGALAGAAAGIAFADFSTQPIFGFIGVCAGLFVVVGLSGAMVAGVIGALVGAVAFAWYFIDKAGTDYSWTPGLTGILLLFVGFLGASMATHEGKHIAVDAIRKNLKSHRFHLYNLVGEIITLLFTVFLGLLAVRYIFHSMLNDEVHADSGLRVWVAVVPIGFAFMMMVIRFSLRIAHSFGAWRRREPAPEFAPELH